MGQVMTIMIFILINCWSTAILWNISKIKEDIDDMKGVYAEILRKENQTTHQCIEKWKETITSLDKAISLLNDIVGENNETD